MNFYKKHFFALCFLLMPFVVPLSLISSTTEFLVAEREYPDSVLWLAVVLSSVVYPLTQGAIILYIASALTGNYLKHSEYYHLALKFWAPLMGLYIIGGIIMFGGFLLLIIPGLILLSRLSFSEFYCLFDKSSAKDALDSSWKSTKDIQWPLLAGILIFSISIFVFLSLFEYFFIFIDFWNPVISFISGLLASFLSPLVTIFSFRVFTYEREKLNK